MNFSKELFNEYYQLLHIQHYHENNENDPGSIFPKRPRVIGTGGNTYGDQLIATREVKKKKHIDQYAHITAKVDTGLVTRNPKKRYGHSYYSRVSNHGTKPSSATPKNKELHPDMFTLPNYDGKNKFNLVSPPVGRRAKTAQEQGAKPNASAEKFNQKEPNSRNPKAPNTAPAGTQRNQAQRFIEPNVKYWKKAPVDPVTNFLQFMDKRSDGHILGKKSPIVETLLAPMFYNMNSESQTFFTKINPVSKPVDNKPAFILTAPKKKYISPYSFH